MSSLTSGAGFQPRLFGGRNLASVLGSYRQQVADLRPAVYIGPVGNGMHYVRNFCNEQLYQVASDRTYAPNTRVLVGSNSGNPGETIFGVAGPGLQGADLFGIQYEQRTLGLRVTVPTSCPNPITGRSYIGIPGSGITPVKALLYHDGTYVSTIASMTPPSGVTFGAWQRLSGNTLIALGSDGSANNYLLTWRLSDNSTFICHSSTINFFSDPVSVGGFIYFYETNISGDLSSVQLRRIALETTGELDLTTSLFGPSYSPASTTFSGNIAAVSASWIEVPATNGSGGIVPYYNGSWRAGTGRTGAIGTSGRTGYPAKGGAGYVAGSQFVNKGGNGFEMQAPDWTALLGGYHSVSPSGGEYVAYQGDDPTQRKLLRAVIKAAPPTGCPIPTIDVGVGPDGHYPLYMLAKDF